MTISNLLDPTETETEELSDVEESQDQADSTEEQAEGEEEDSAGTDDDLPTGVPPNVEVPPPEAELLGSVAALLGLQKKLRDTEDESKRVAKQWRDRVATVDAQIDSVMAEIEGKKWHEVFDPNAGVVYRWNKLNPDEMETLPYEPPLQQDLPWVDERLRGVEVGQYGEDQDGNVYVVRRIDRDSVLIQFCNDGTLRVGASEWEEHVSRLNNAEYEQDFADEQAAWTASVLEAISEEGSTVAQIAEAMFLEGEHHEARIAAALGRLSANHAARATERDGVEVWVLQDPDDGLDASEPMDGGNCATPFLSYVTEQWEAISSIAERAGMEKATAAREIKKEIEAGRVEAEGERRGRKYRLVVA